MKLSELPASLNLNILRDGEFTLLGKATTAYLEGQIALSYLTELKYLDGMAANPHIGCVIVKDEFMDQVHVPHWGLISAKDPKLAFTHIHNALAQTDFYWPDFATVIDPTAVIMDGAWIAPRGVKIGKNCLVEPLAVIHRGSILHDHVIIRSGAQIGTAGFEFYHDGSAIHPVTTAGRAVLHDYVEIQHGTCVDRGMYGGDTILYPHVKVDNMVHVAHDVVVGERTCVVVGVVLGGRTVVGKDCWIGPNAVVSNGLTVGDNATVSLGAIVTKNVADGQTVSGNFAIDHAKFLQFIKSIR